MRRIIIFASTIGPVAAAVLTGSPSRANPVHEVQVVAKQFAFEPAVIQVTEGEPIRLAMRSADRAHGFAIRDLTIDVQSRAAETSSSNSPPHVPGGTKSPAPNSAGAGMGR